jgi:dCTP deaminase
MILTRTEIQELIKQKKLCFEPELDGYQNQPHAVDLRLGTTFYISKMWKVTDKGREILTVDVTENAQDTFEKIKLKPGQFFELAPGESIIASTLEKISLKSDDLMGVLYPRSSINRRGLSVDLTGIVDAHYSGNLMIPIFNKTANQVIRIYPGERICQLVFQKLVSDLSHAEANLHGKIPAKYEGAKANELSLKKDDNLEIELIKKGNLEELKKIKF